MDLISWHLDLSLKCENRPNVCISVRLSVECSVCRMIYKFTTDHYALRGDIHPATIDGIVDDVFTPRPCVYCGVLQTLSEHDKGKLRKDAEALITDAWVKAQYQKPAA